MKASDLIPQLDMEINIPDEDIEDELESLLDDPNKPKKPKAKNQKKGQKPPPKKVSLNDAEMLLKGTDNIDVDDIELNSDDLEILGDDFKDLKDAPKPKQSDKIKFSKEISDDDDVDIDEAELAPKATPKQKLKPKKTTYKKEQVQQVELTYEDVFDYFSGNFYNFLFSVDEPKIAQQYMTQMENLAPIIFEGEEKFDSKDLKINFLSLPKKIVPFGHWTNISSAELKVDALIPENKNVRKILNEQLENLQKMKNEANSRREEESVKEIDRAIKLTNQSLKAAFPKPEFLVSDYIQLQHSAQNTSLSEKEIQISFKSITNCSCKDKYHILVEISGIGRFQSRKLSGPNNDNLNESYNQTYDPKKLQNAVNKGGKVTVGDKTAQFSLSELVHKSTAEIVSNISGTTISFNVSIRTPLSGEKTTFELKEFFCCPTILTEALDYTPRKEVAIDHSPKVDLKAKPKPANSPPHLVILSKEEQKLFWGTKATENLADPVMIDYFKKNNFPIPKEYVDQVNFFAGKMKEFEKMQETGDLDPNQYLADLQAALKREQAKLPKFSAEDAPIRKLLVNSIQAEAKEIEEMLAEDE